MTQGGRSPQEAVEQARASLTSMRAAGAYPAAESAGDPPPSGHVTLEMLMQWAMVEPELRHVRSTRRLGAPITAVKRLLLRLLAQYHMELLSEQSRFNAAAALYLRELERRIEALEHRERNE